MKMKYHSKPGVKLKTTPPLRQPCSKYKKVMSGRSRQRKKIPCRIVRRGC